MKRFSVLFLFFSLLMLPSLSLAQGAHRISQVVVKGNGISANISPGSKILVCVLNTGCATAANIYLDSALTTPARNPLTADGSGNYDYYISSGCVDEQISSPGQGSIFVPNVCPFNGQGGGGSGNVIATPQFRMYLQPNTGTQAVAQGAVVGQNGVAPMLQGTINSDLYASGGGNNGITNAIASSDCTTAGCYFARTQTSTDTENIGALLNSAGNYTHATDSQYGIAGQYFWNVGINTVGKLLDGSQAELVAFTKRWTIKAWRCAFDSL